ncbi:uncharacterized protein C1orf131 homolog isoform X2 [Pseudochaenichthys georgianus]|uniref:uncharacterized protein C1orf131 homolog isoform X2 n=1 Tax=Pseudochaenichthys georgianus TaxID=52239 RepID=UPI001469E6C7|nr:uncharacterized protein C1orf131 homolog isoform X2 [Pseudochaenichthys georgianus]
MNGKEDEDCLFLENILDKLYEFDYGPASKKKKSQKKNKRKRCEEEEKEVPAVSDACSDSEEADHVGTDEQQQVKREQTAIKPASTVEVVTFQDPRKKPRIKQKPFSDKKPAPPKITGEKESDQPEELSLEKARLEVHRFGITGYKKEQQRVFEQDRAVMLGARPPKKEYTNYKMLQQQIKEKKQKAREEVQPELKKKKKTSNPRDKKKRVSSGSGSRSEPSGQMGRFKNGMLILSSKEIQNVKGNKKRK